MAETVLKLARNLSQVKQLSSDVTLSTYYQEIKPFLFGTQDTTPIKKGSLPEGGIYKIAKTGIMSPSDDKIIIKVAEKIATEYKIANVRNTQFITEIQPDKDGNRKKLPSEFFFPSDLVRILTALARIFYNGKFNVDALFKYASSSSDNLDFVKQWAQVDSEPELLKKDVGFFYEEKLERLHAGDIQALLTAVIDAAEQFENQHKKANLEGFDPQTEIENKVVAAIVPQIFEKIIEEAPTLLKRQEGFEETIKPILEKKKEIITEAVEKIKEKFTAEIKSLVTVNKIDFLRDLFSQQNLYSFAEAGIYDQETKYFLFQERTTDGQKGLVDSPIYHKFVEQAIKKFIDNENQTDELVKKHIVPLFKPEVEAAAGESEATSQEGGDQPKIEEQVVLENPISFEVFKRRLADDVVKSLTESFLVFVSSQYTGDFSRYKNRIVDNYLSPVLESLRNQVEVAVVTPFEIIEEEKDELIQQELFALGNFSQNVFESEWYNDLLTQSSEYILQTASSPDSQYSSYFEFLYEQYISPAIVLLEEETPEQAEAEEDVTVTQRPTGAVVPTEIPTSAPTTVIQTKTDEINRLTPEQIRSLQYESAWMYNRAVYELFTSQGINQKDIDPLVLQTLQEKVFIYATSMNSEDFNKLFGSASYRQKALLDFYQKTGYGIDKFHNAQELLGATLFKSFNLDSPVVTKNIENTLDSLILQYGLNQTFYGFDPDTKTVTEFSGKNAHDVIWFIENIPNDRLALIFNLPSSLTFNDETITRLKKVLKDYAQYRGSELSLHIQNISIQKGLIHINAADAEKIKKGDQETIVKHLSFTNDLRDMTKKLGGESVAGALDEKSKSHRKEIQKQFKTFLPLWNQLSGVEQAEVYRNYDIPIPPEYLTNGKPDPRKLEIAKLAFIPEFAFFDVRKFDEIKNIIKRNNLDRAKQLELEEIASIQDQLIKEQRIAEFLNSVYDNNSQESELVEIYEYAGVDEGELSFREKFDIDQTIEESGTRSSQRRDGLASRITNRFRKEKEARLNPLEKAKKATKKAAGEAISQGLSKAAAAGISAVLPGLGAPIGAALMAVKNQKVRNFLSTAVLGGLAFIIGRTIWALGSIGGLIGGIVGGVGGFVFLGGPAGILPGVIIGANAGEFLASQLGLNWRWDNALFGKSAQAPTLIPPEPSMAAARIPAAAAPVVVTQPYVPPPPKDIRTPKLTDVINTTAGIGIVAAGAFALMGVVITLFVIFTIQSAFLIPVPKARTSTGAPILGSFGCFEFGPAGYTKQIGSPPVATTSIEWTESDQTTLEAGFAKVASNNQYIDLLCSAGPITVYRFPVSTQGFWGWVTGPNEMILYGGAFGSTAGMEYVLIHETGHIIQGRNPGLVSNFLQIKTDSSCYTYPFPDLCNYGEAFAEGLVLYVTGDFFFGNSAWSGAYPFQANYPAEYNWYKNNVFGGQEY